MRPLSRREFLQVSASAAGLSALAATSPVPGSPTGLPRSPVAVGRCSTYHYATVKTSLASLFNLLGDVDALVKGRPVTMKVLAHPPDTVDSVNQFFAYDTHPEVVRAAARLFLERGATHINIIDSVYHKDIGAGAFEWVGYDIKSFVDELGAANVTFLNTRNKGTSPTYVKMLVGPRSFLYDSFILNDAYYVEKNGGVFVSLAKMKNHQVAGVTLSMKNLFGVPPCSQYGQDAPNEESISYRGDSFHEAKPRFPGRNQFAGTFVGDNVARVIVDINRARPIHLAILDGVVVMHGGEGPWNRSHLGITSPGLLVAGRNPVCTDSVAAAIMGYNPDGEHYRYPWANGCNHLALAAARGIGTNRLEEIEVRGLPIADAQYNLPPTRDETP